MPTSFNPSNSFNLFDLAARNSSVPRSFNLSNSYDPSYSFDFSSIDSSSLPSSGSEFIFGMDQDCSFTPPDTSQLGTTASMTPAFPSPASQNNGTVHDWNFAPSDTSQLGTTTPAFPSPASQNNGTDHDWNFAPSDTSQLGTTTPAFPSPASQNNGIDQDWNFTPPDTSQLSTTTPAFPSPASQNNATSMTAGGFILQNGAYSEQPLNTATNTMSSSGAANGTSDQEEDRLKKRKTYEEQNAHCILPEGSRRSRKSRRIEGAEDENAPGPKKRNGAKKGKPRGPG
jgi:hypothetical protein